MCNIYNDIQTALFSVENRHNMSQLASLLLHYLDRAPPPTFSGVEFHYFLTSHFALENRWSVSNVRVVEQWTITWHGCHLNFCVGPINTNLTVGKAVWSVVIKQEEAPEQQVTWNAKISRLPVLPLEVQVTYWSFAFLVTHYSARFCTIGGTHLKGSHLVRDGISLLVVE